MSRAQSNTTAYVEIDGREYRVGPDRDLVEVMNRIEAITRSEPAFVDLSNGDLMVSVLVSPGARVIVTVCPNTPEAISAAVTEDWSLELPYPDWE